MPSSMHFMAILVGLMPESVPHGRLFPVPFSIMEYRASLRRFLVSLRSALSTDIFVQILFPAVLMSLSSACCISSVMELFPPAIFSVHSTAISLPT